MTDAPGSEAEPLNDSAVLAATDVVGEAISEHSLMPLRALPARVGSEPSAPPPTASPAALQPIGEAAPAMQTALRHASASGQALQLSIKRPMCEATSTSETTLGLETGRLLLLQPLPKILQYTLKNVRSSFRRLFPGSLIYVDQVSESNLQLTDNVKVFVIRRIVRKRQGE